MLRAWTLWDYAMMAGLFMAMAAGGLVGIWYLFRKVGTRKANICLGLLLVFFALSLGRNIGTYFVDDSHLPMTFYYPFWMNLWFGPFLFFYIKYALFPGYLIRWSDGKHFIAPLIQSTFYSYAVTLSSAERWALWHEGVIPVYKAMEGFTYVVSFFGYMFLAYRYLKYKEAVLKRRPMDWVAREIGAKKRLIRLLYMLGFINIGYVVLDFTLYYLLGWNLNAARGLSMWSDLTFAVMLLWLAYWSFRERWLDFSGYSGASTNIKSIQLKDLEQWVGQEQRWADPSLTLATMSRYMQIPKPSLEAVFQEESIGFFSWIANIRAEQVEFRKTDKRYIHHHWRSIAMECGFSDGASFREVRK